MKLQQDDAVKEEYREQYELIIQMEKCANAGATDQELILQNKMEQRRLAGRKQVYYEDFFSKYLGLGQEESIANRISYREYLIDHNLPLLCKVNMEYSFVYIIYKLFPILLPFVIIIISMTLTLIFTDESIAGTSKILLIHAYKRQDILLAKYFISIMAATIMAFFFILMLSLPLCNQESSALLNYPVKINFSTLNSFLIGDVNFVTAENFFTLCLLAIPINVMFYLSLFTLITILFSSSACVIISFVLLAAYTVVSVNMAIPFIKYIPFYYTNTYLLLTGDANIQHFFLILVIIFFGGIVLDILGIRIFERKDFL